ncbi:16S rRNA (adenine(1518)-N(6)/adenine(1519)-N(6))-dimethyltransferase, partial [Gardnerella vaginalis]
MDGIKLTQNNISEQEGSLLGAADIRRIAAEEGITPTKKFGQNFVIDPGTVKKIVTASKINSNDFVMEVGPGLGSLTLAILQAGANLTAVEIDPPLAKRLPSTVKEFMPNALERFNVILKDALELNAQDVPNLANAQHFTLVANLPYNVATPIILTLLEKFNNLTSFLVMVQKEVADRLCAQPGTKTYGTPSVKLAWYGESQKAGLIGRNVFWPAPNVDSALV